MTTTGPNVGNRNNVSLERTDKPAVVPRENPGSRTESGDLLTKPNNGIQDQSKRPGLPSQEQVNKICGSGLTLSEGQDKQPAVRAGNAKYGTAKREASQPHESGNRQSETATQKHGADSHRPTTQHESGNRQSETATQKHGADSHRPTTQHESGSRQSETATQKHGADSHRPTIQPHESGSRQSEPAKVHQHEDAKSYEQTAHKPHEVAKTPEQTGHQHEGTKSHEPAGHKSQEVAKTPEQAEHKPYEGTRAEQSRSATSDKAQAATQRETKSEIVTRADKPRQEQQNIAAKVDQESRQEPKSKMETKQENKQETKQEQLTVNKTEKTVTENGQFSAKNNDGSRRESESKNQEALVRKEDRSASSLAEQPKDLSPVANSNIVKTDNASVSPLGEAKVQPNEHRLTDAASSSHTDKTNSLSTENINNLGHNSLAKKNDSLKLDEEENVRGQQSKSLAHNEKDDDRLTLTDLHEQNLLKNQSDGVAARSVDAVQQNFSNAGPAQQFDLARSTTATNAEVPISHSVQHSTFISGEHFHGITRASVHAQEINNNNDPKSQSAADPNLAHSTSGHTSQSHSGTSHQTGAGHGSTGSHGQGHDPSAHGHHSGHGSSHGTGHGQHQHGPGHGPNGHSKDPSGHGKDPNGHDPSGQGHDPTGQGHDPTGQGIGTNGHDPNGQGNSPTGQGHDPTGQGHDPSGQGTTLPGSGNNQPGGNGNGPGTGVDPIPGQPLPSGGYGHIPYEGQPFPIYEERPIRNLVTLISEMGAALGPLHNIWSPWGEIGVIPGQANLIAIHNPIYDNPTTSNGISSTQYQPLEPVSINNNPISIIDQPQALINTQVIGDVITGNNGQTISNGPYSNQLPVIETTTSGNSIPTDNGASPSSINGGINGGAQGNVTNTGTSSNTAANTSTPADTTASNAASNGQLTGQIGQDANTPASQFLNGSVDYWTTNSNPGNNPNMPAPNSPTPINDPVPVDNSPNAGQPSDMLPNHDQLVSGAEHHHGVKDNTDNTDQNQQKSRAELSDPCLQNDEQKHHAQTLQDQKDAQQLEELKHRLELIANGMWQEPNKNDNGNKKPEVKESTNNSGRKTPVRNDGLIGQIIALLNDVNKGKKSNANRTYVVKEGDTLESIAANVLLDIRLAFLLYLINQPTLVKQVGIEWKQIKLPRGTVLYLPGEGEINTFRLAMPRGVGQGRANSITNGPPSQWQFDKQYVQGIDQRRRNVERLLGPLGSVNTKYDPETDRQFIAVRLGDTLRSIALKNPALNDVSLWKLLAKCNNLSTEVDSKGAPIALLTRGMVLQLPGEEEIIAYRASQAALVRAHSPRKAIAAEVLSA